MQEVLEAERSDLILLLKLLDVGQARLKVADSSPRLVSLAALLLH